MAELTIAQEKSRAAFIGSIQSTVSRNQQGRKN
jgi:hypothetical protein